MIPGSVGPTKGSWGPVTKFVPEASTITPQEVHDDQDRRSSLDDAARYMKELQKSLADRGVASPAVVTMKQLTAQERTLVEKAVGPFFAGVAQRVIPGEDLTPKCPSFMPPDYWCRRYAQAGKLVDILVARDVDLATLEHVLAPESLGEFRELHV